VVVSSGLHPQWDFVQVPRTIQWGRRMWSFEDHKARGDELLASTLLFRGLPLHWMPTLVTSFYYGRPLLPDHLPFDDWVQCDRSDQ
jgi:hypothetical protein